MAELGLSVHLSTDFATAQQRVTDALKAEGFGVLTEIDVKATLKQKLDVDFRSYKILGACNPTLAHRALSAEPEIGLLLPCNVTLSEVAPGEVDVSLVNPISMMNFVEHPALESIADEAYQRLSRVQQALASHDR